MNDPTKTPALPPSREIVFSHGAYVTRFTLENEFGFVSISDGRTITHAALDADDIKSLRRFLGAQS